MASSVLITFLFLARFTMAIVAGYIGYMWGMGVDNAIFICLGCFLLLMFLGLEYSDNSNLIYPIYSAIIIAVPISYVLISLYGELVITSNSIK
jgi:hypothetical protein